jgi:uncharacterized protein YbjQ (UPF0145 family)
MKRLVVVLAAAALFLGSCGPQEVGEMQRQSEALDVENAQSIIAELKMGGGRSAGYEGSLRRARETVIGEMVAEAEQQEADAVVGVDVDYESIQVGQGGSMLKVSA